MARQAGVSAGSKEFYAGLFGWHYADHPIPDGGVYVMATLGGRRAAAMFETTDRHPAWASYGRVLDRRHAPDIHDVERLRRARSSRCSPAVSTTDEGTAAPRRL